MQDRQLNPILLTIAITTALTGCGKPQLNPVGSWDKPTQTDAYLYGRFEMRTPNNLTYAFVIRCDDGNEYMIPFLNPDVSTFKIAPAKCALQGAIFGNFSEEIRRKDDIASGMSSIEFAAGKAYYLGDFVASAGERAPDSPESLPCDKHERPYIPSPHEALLNELITNGYDPRLSLILKLGHKNSEVKCSGSEKLKVGQLLVWEFERWGDQYEKTTNEWKLKLPNFAAMPTEKRLLMAAIVDTPAPPAKSYSETMAGLSREAQCQKTLDECRNGCKSKDDRQACIVECKKQESACK